jgi:hypothetical protein
MCWRFRKFVFAVLAAAGLVGCGGSVVRPLPAGGSGAAGELILVDSATAARFSVSVVNGTPTLTGVGSSGTISADPELIDGATGERFSLAVTGGALMLIPATGAGGAAEIGFVDTVTAKTYTLAVVRGALRLSES